MSGSCCDVVNPNAEPGVALDEDKLSALIWRIGVAAVLAGQSMMLGLGINMTPPSFGTPIYWTLHGILLCATLAVLVLLGKGLFVESFKSWMRREITVESLFFLSMSGALVASVISTVTGRGEVYYEVVAIVLCIYTLGKALGTRSREKAVKESNKLKESFDFAYLLQEGERKKVPLESVGCCCEVITGPGDAITVDGVILEGESYVKETAMTGELEAQVRQKGDFVLAGSYCVDGSLKIKPTALKGERRIDALLASVEHAGLQPSALQEQANRVMAWFLPLVILVAAGTFVYWLGQVFWVSALFNSMSVLLVACPCALGLATPLAVWSGLWRLSTLGIISKSGDFLDALAKVDKIIFDKTGTLSHEKLSVDEVLISNDFVSRKDEIVDMVKSVERLIEHPIARTLAQLPSSGRDFSVSKTRIIPGRGVLAHIEGEGEMFIGEKNLDFENNLSDFPEAKKVVYIYLNGKGVGGVVLVEKMRLDVSKTVEDLSLLNIGSEVLTGDASYKEKSLGKLSVRSNMTPQEKEEYVKVLEKKGERVIYVGDGINDAGAMSHCTASIAMGSGAALTKSSSSAVLVADNIDSLPRAIRLARALKKSVRGNMLYAVSYNALGMTFGALGLLHPVIAALVMVVSSTFVSWRVIKSTNQTY